MLAHLAFLACFGFKAVLDRDTVISKAKQLPVLCQIVNVHLGFELVSGLYYLLL